MSVTQDEIIRNPPGYAIDVVLYKGRPWPFFAEGLWDRIRKFPLDYEDVVVTGYPKSGTNWTQIQITNLFGWDYWQTTRITENHHVPTWDTTWGMNLVELVSSPRLLKSHLWRESMPSCWPEKGKIVHITRNPKDVCVSNFNTFKKTAGLSASWDDYVKHFASGKSHYGPFWENVISWETFEHPNLLNIRYEEMKKNPLEVMTRVADFIGKPYDRTKLEEVVAGADFDKMKQETKSKLRGLHEKGQSGTWKSHFTEEQSRLIDREIDARLRDHGIELDYE